MVRVIWIAAAIACSGRPPPAQPAASPAGAAVAGATVADAGAPADAAPLDQDLPRLAERSLAMYQDIAKAFSASEDCAAAVARLHELTGRYRDVTLANAKVLHDGHAKELKVALAPHSAELDAAAAAVVHSDVVSRCAQDPKFSRAFDELLAPPP